MDEFDTTRCVICGQAFTLRTGNTFWVAAASREIVGVAHLQCQRRRGSGYSRVWINRTASIDDLRFIAWHFAHIPRPLRGADKYAVSLIQEGMPADTPTVYQTRMLAYWSQPDSAVGAALAEAAWRRYLELLADYRAYTAKAPGANGC